MTSNVSFSSLFNPERISRKNAEKLSNPEYNIEGLRNDAERPKDFPVFPNDSIGRSQVIIKQNQSDPHKLELTKDDRDFIFLLSSSTYGFHDNSNDFWVNTRERVNGRYNGSTMGDGKILDGKTRHDFAKGLVNNETQAFQIAGSDKLGGNKLITVVKNSETGKTTMYTCDSKECYQTVIDKPVNLEKIASAITDNLTSILGVTIWKE